MHLQIGSEAPLVEQEMDVALLISYFVSYRTVNQIMNMGYDYE